MRKEFKKLSKYHIELKEVHQSKDINSLTETTQNNKAYESLKKEFFSGKWKSFQRKRYFNEGFSHFRR